MERLDLPSVAQPVEDLAATSLVNAKMIQQGIDRLGVNLLVATKSREAITVGTTYIKLPAFQSSVRTSGGLIAVLANVAAAGVSSTHGSYLQLLVDDVEVDVAVMGMLNDLRLMLPLVWVGVLPAGQHTFKLYGRSNADTTIFGTTDADNTMYVVELMRG